MRRSATVETDDNELIAKAIEGDRKAFGELYKRYSLRVFRHAYFLTNDAVLAEDITGQVFLKALEAIHRYEARGVPFISWLFRITCNMVINHRKSAKNGNHLELRETIEDRGTFSSPEHSCELKVDGERVWREVSRLPSEQRQVIVMRFVDDLGYPDIADVLGKSVGAVRVIQFRALSNLRNLLADELNLYRVRRAGKAPR